MNTYLSDSINNCFIETAIEKELKKALFQIYMKCIFMIKSNCIKFFFLNTCFQIFNLEITFQ